MASLSRVLAAATACVGSAQLISLDISKPGVPYDGIGALSGGGGVTRLLIDYPAAIQQDILDMLFLPNAGGASLQHIKVEIGGDTQSTEGTEATHSRFRGDLNCTRGYEWWVLQEAKRRNPAIQTYALSWGVPGWIGNGTYYSADNIQYHLDFVACAKGTWGIDLDWLGIWNERKPDMDWIKELRAALDNAGMYRTRIVAADTDWSIANTMLTDEALRDAVDVVGAHYPGSAPPAAAVQGLPGKAFWASEMWNLDDVDDYSGSLTLASDLNQQALWGLSSSIVWCLVHSWYSILPFSKPTATNAGAGHSLLTAAEPWSGHYEVNAPLAVVAHHTQFAWPGWTYLRAGSGMGSLPSGGTYVTLFDGRVGKGLPLRVSVVIESNAASAAQSASFQLVGLDATHNATMPSSLHVWQTTASALFVQLPDIPVAADGTFTLAAIPPKALVTVSSTTGQSWIKAPRVPIPATAPFPFPYSDDFSGYAQGAYARFFSDEGGVFEVAVAPADYTSPSRHVGSCAAALPIAVIGGAALKNVVSVPPIAWETNPNPYTLLGNFNGGANQSAWTDYTVTVSAAIDSSVPPAPGPRLLALQQPCSPPAPSQGWMQSPAGGLRTPTGATLGSVAFPGMCLGLLGASPLFSGATTVGLVNCSIAAVSSWRYDDGSQNLMETATGLCVDIYNQNKSAGAATVAFPCNGGANQHWRLGASTARAMAFSINSTLEDLCLDIAASTLAPPAYLMLSSRIHSYTREGAPPDGYNFIVYQSANATAMGTYRLSVGKGKMELCSGALPFPIQPGDWHTLSLVNHGSMIRAVIDGATACAATDTTSAYGMVAMGSGWHLSWFDAFSVRNVTTLEQQQCADS